MSVHRAPETSLSHHDIFMYQNMVSIKKMYNTHDFVSGTVLVSLQNTWTAANGGGENMPTAWLPRVPSCSGPNTFQQQVEEVNYINSYTIDYWFFAVHVIITGVARSTLRGIKIKHHFDVVDMTKERFCTGSYPNMPQMSTARYRVTIGNDAKVGQRDRIDIN